MKKNNQILKSANLTVPSLLNKNRHVYKKNYENDDIYLSFQ